MPCEHSSQERFAGEPECLCVKPRMRFRFRPSASTTGYCFAPEGKFTQFLFPPIPFPRRIDEQVETSMK